MPPHLEPTAAEVIAALRRQVAELTRENNDLAYRLSCALAAIPPDREPMWNPPWDAR